MDLGRLRPYPVSAFAGVTLAIWGNRVWLAWTQPDTDVAAKLALSIPITAFVVASIVVLVLMLRGVDRTLAGFRNLVRAFAAGTALFWAIRAPMIMVRDHGVPFKVVHAVLAVVSVVAAAAAWRSLDRHDSRAPEASSEPTRPNALV
jgi:hypothetical protein